LSAFIIFISLIAIMLKHNPTRAVGHKLYTY
jgi:hypothetical protein